MGISVNGYKGKPELRELERPMTDTERAEASRLALAAVREAAVAEDEAKDAAANARTRIKRLKANAAELCYRAESGLVVAPILCVVDVDETARRRTVRRTDTGVVVESVPLDPQRPLPGMDDEPVSAEQRAAELSALAEAEAEGRVLVVPAVPDDGLWTGQHDDADMDG